jgi:hypothetical protein
VICIRESDSTNPASYAWVKIKGEQGVQGPQGEIGGQGPIGPQGPAGTPGYLGLKVTNGNTLSIMGFDSNGELVSNTGYLYIGDTRFEIQTFSQSLTADGKGYVIFDGMNIKFVKLFINENSSNWVQFNDSNTIITSNFWIIGSFNITNGIIIDKEIFYPQKKEEFELNQFMNILASNNIDNINSWANSNGISAVFEKIAILEAFINKLVANQLRVGGGSESNGFLFKVEENNGQAIIAAYYNSKMIFSIDGNTGEVNIEGKGNFNGLIDSEPLTSQQFENGDPYPSTPSKSIWSTDELYNELTSITITEAIQSAAGSYGGKIINGITRLYSEQNRAVIKSYIETTEYLFIASSNVLTEEIALASYVVPPYAYKTSIAIDVFKGTKLSAIGNGVFFYVDGAEIYKSDWISSSYYATYSFYGDIPAGSVISIVIKAQNGQNQNYATKYKNIAIRTYSTITGKGVFLKYTDGTYGIIRDSQYRNDVFSLTSPSWVSSGNLNYISGTDFYNSFSGLALGVAIPCSGSLTINGGGYTLQTVNPIYVKRTSTNIQFQMTNGSFITVEKWAGLPSSFGVYIALSCSITTIGQLSAIKFNNLLPKTSSAAIGQDGNRIGSVFVTTLNATSGEFHGKCYAT